MFLPTTADRRQTTVIESPRTPQHVTRGLRTQAERQAMAQRFPDLKKIRAEVLASLTPEERARVEARRVARQGAEIVVAGETPALSGA